jgi:hypothetical protein
MNKLEGLSNLPDDLLEIASYVEKKEAHIIVNITILAPDI